jgi:HEAT repeat protein
MQKPEFNHCIEMLRSTDSIVYEDGYQWLQGYLDSNIDELIQLTLDEENPDMRSKFVELLGDSGNPEVIPFIEAELKSPHQEVRSWAYSSLRYFGDLNAKKIAIKFRNENPDEDFL